MKRRGNREGSIYRRKDGLWTAAVHVGYSAGRRRRRYFYGKTRAEVAEKLAQAQNEAAQDATGSGRLTVMQYLERWLREYASRLRPKTYYGYENIVRRHLIPALGHLQLKRLSPEHIQVYFEKKLLEGLSKRTVEQHHEALGSALSQAERLGLVSRNMARLVTPPTPERRTYHVLTPEEAARLLEAVQDDRLEALFTVGLALGMRQGEILGLRWEDIDLERGALRVNRQLQRLRGETRFPEPKSKQSRRLIYLPDAVRNALRRHRTRQLEERLRATL